MTWEKLDKPKFFISLTGTLIWLFAPFATINIFSFSDPPAAVENLFSYPFYMDSIFEYPLFWVSLLMGLPFFIGLLSSLKCNEVVTNIFAFISLPAFFGYAITIISEAGSLTYFTNLFGYGYWLIGFLDFVLLFIYKSNDNTNTTDIENSNVVPSSSNAASDNIPESSVQVSMPDIDLDKTIEDYATNRLFINSQKPYIYTNEQNQKNLEISSDNNAIIPKRPQEKLLNSAVNHSITEFDLPG